MSTYSATELLHLPIELLQRILLNSPVLDARDLAAIICTSKTLATVIGVGTATELALGKGNNNQEIEIHERGSIQPVHNQDMVVRVLKSVAKTEASAARHVHTVGGLLAHLNKLHYDGTLTTDRYFPDDCDIRQAAVEALGAAGHRSAQYVGLIGKSLEYIDYDEDSDEYETCNYKVVMAAVKVLSDLGELAVPHIHEIIGTFESRWSRVQQAAVIALGKLIDHLSIEHLRAVVDYTGNGEDHDVRLVAASAMIQIGSRLHWKITGEDEAKRRRLF